MTQLRLTSALHGKGCQTVLTAIAMAFYSALMQRPSTKDLRAIATTIACEPSIGCLSKMTCIAINQYTWNVSFKHSKMSALPNRQLLKLHVDKLRVPDNLDSSRTFSNGISMNYR